MSAWDRRDAIARYDAMFEGRESEEEVIAELGSPTKLAISLALNYVPSPPPAVIATEELSAETPAPQTEEAPADGSGEVSAEAAPEEAPACSPESVKTRKVRPFGLIVAILFGLVIGLPIAIVLIVVGLPFLASGLAIIAGDVGAVLYAVPLLTMFSDILAVVGGGLVICSLGLLIAWFGLWLSFELGWLWISGVIFRLGRALTYKKEVAEK